MRFVNGFHDSVATLDTEVIASYVATYIIALNSTMGKHIYKLSVMSERIHILGLTVLPKSYCNTQSAL